MVRHAKEHHPRSPTPVARSPVRSPLISPIRASTPVKSPLDEETKETPKLVPIQSSSKLLSKSKSKIVDEKLEQSEVQEKKLSQEGQTAQKAEEKETASEEKLLSKSKSDVKELALIESSLQKKESHHLQLVIPDAQNTQLSDQSKARFSFSKGESEEEPKVTRSLKKVGELIIPKTPERNAPTEAIEEKSTEASDSTLNKTFPPLNLEKNSENAKTAMKSESKGSKMNMNVFFSESKERTPRKEPLEESRSLKKVNTPVKSQKKHDK